MLYRAFFDKRCLARDGFDRKLFVKMVPHDTKGTVEVTLRTQHGKISRHVVSNGGLVGIDGLMYAIGQVAAERNPR